MIYLGSSISANLDYDSVISIETNISDKGLPTFEIYGLINKSIEESKKRILNSFESSAFTFPLKNININLAPAEIPKEGTHLDFAIAATILKHTHNFNFNEKLELFLGELSFEGRVMPVKNILFLILTAQIRGFKKIYLSKDSFNNIYGVENMEIIGVEFLKDLFITSNQIKYTNSTKINREDYGLKFNQIIGSQFLKRKLALSLAGRHHILIEGFPGSGKSMLAKASEELLPDLDHNKAVEVTKIHSYLGIERGSDFFYRPPFRSPHNSSSYSSIFGSSGRVLYPGEISLANHGILFLDEITEFNRLVIEGLRIPLEDKMVNISRAKLKKSFKSDFILIATMNPCKCGYFNHPKVVCKCLPSDIKRYRSKISGPILDRIDIFISFDSFTNLNTPSEQKLNSFNDFLKLKEKIKSVNEYLERDFTDKSKKDTSRIKDKLFEQYNIADSAINIVNELQDIYSISNRKLFKILKLSKTISIFEGREKIINSDIQEAISLSNLNWI